MSTRSGNQEQLISAQPSPTEHQPDLTRTPDEPIPPFSELGVRPETLVSLGEMGITTPFAIQALAVPLALAGSDVIGQARTGTGKTLAFGIPLLQRVDVGPGSPHAPQALVVVPTRELCLQVARDLERAGGALGVRVLAIYGGRAYEPQIAALTAGVQVVVGTPGRLIDLAEQRHLDLSGVRMLVLDEADEMLDLGFLPDVERILSRTQATGRQTMLFSATMPGPVLTLSRRFLSQPVHVRAEAPDEGRTVPDTAQHVFRAHSLDKVELLARLLQARGRGLTMVFCRTKRTCDRVAADLVDRGFAAAAVHGDLGQGAREQALRAFRSGKIDVLVATDVAARGIDVAGVTHVVNYQCPEDETVYLHRIGRTGRAGEKGVAVTFVDWDDVPRWNLICTTLALPFADPVETYSTSAHFFDALDIPGGTRGALPRGQRVRAGLGAEVIEDIGETGRRSRRGEERPAARTGGRAAAEPAPTRTRNRRRTRGGGATGATDTATPTVVAVGGPAGSSGPVGSSGPAGSGGPAGTAAGAADRPARRRRRGGRGRSTGSLGGQNGAPNDGQHDSSGLPRSESA